MNTSTDTGNKKRRPVSNKEWLQGWKARWWPVHFGESVGTEPAKRKDGPSNIGAWACVILAVLCFVATLALVLNGFLETEPLDQEQWTQRGQRGDFWGGHVAAGAGMMGTFLFVAALLFQYSELKAQREDLALHRQEFEKSTQVAEKQANVLEGQRIELEEQSRTLRHQTELILKRDDAQFMLALGEKAAGEFPGGLRPRPNVIRLGLSHIVERAVEDFYYALELLSLFKAGSRLEGRDYFMEPLREWVEMHKEVGTRPGKDGDWDEWLGNAEAVIEPLVPRDPPEE